MFVQFKVENFFSIKEQQIFSMVADNSSNLKDHTFSTPDGKLKLLKTAVIYGANAAGKSNILLAMNLMREMVLKSHSNQRGETNKNYVPFMLCNDTKNSASSFEIIFYVDANRFHYGFSFNAEKIITEFLYEHPKGTKRVVFERDNTESDSIHISENLKPKRLYKDIHLKTGINTLFLSKCAQEKSEFMGVLFDWFLKSFNTMLGGIDPEMTAKRSVDQAFKKNLLQFLHANDTGIKDIDVSQSSLREKFQAEAGNIPEEVKQKILEELKDEVVYEIKTIHLNDLGEKVIMPFRYESQGTKKLFSLASSLIDGMLNSSILIIDELSAALHPNIMEFIVEYFNKSNTSAQLIFTTHDTHLISSNKMRKDQIWFVEKNEHDETNLYSLLEFNPRNERENWELRYLSGRYGAVPNISAWNLKRE